VCGIAVVCAQNGRAYDRVACGNVIHKSRLAATISVRSRSVFANGGPDGATPLDSDGSSPTPDGETADSPDPFPSPTLQASWKGGGSLAAAVAGGKSELHRARGRVTPVRPEIHAGGHVERHDRQTVPQRRYRPGRKVRVRVKRRFKRPPLATQEAGHGKPPREQDQIGNLRCGPHRIGASRSGSGYRSLREMTLSLAQVRKTEFGLQPFQDTISPLIRGEIRHGDLRRGSPASG
jgi:hypothetical protein